MVKNMDRSWSVYEKYVYVYDEGINELDGMHTGTGIRLRPNEQYAMPIEQNMRFISELKTLRCNNCTLYL